MKKKVPVKKPKKSKPVDEQIVYKKEGWICPNCGGGIAPDVERCPCKPMNPYPSPSDPIPWRPFPTPSPWKFPLGGPEIID